MCTTINYIIVPVTNMKNIYTMVQVELNNMFDVFPTVHHLYYKDTTDEVVRHSVQIL